MVVDSMFPESEVTEKGAYRLSPEGDIIARDRPALIVIAGPRLGEVVRLQGSDIVIGRAMDANVQVLEQGVSRRHAVITLLQSKAFIEDLGSSNGTLVNGKPTEGRVPLRDGDKIQAGFNTIFKFTYIDVLDESFQKAMYDSAMRDALTSTFNRAYFDESLHREFAFALRHNANLALLMVDIDHFKAINDTHGHQAGDLVLKRTARRLEQALRTEDALCRYGGEEFAILCRGTPTQGAVLLAERLRTLLECDRIDLPKGPTVSVTASVGVAGFQDVMHEEPLDLVARADSALLEAKQNGRNRVVLCAPVPCRDLPYSRRAP